MKPNEKLIEQHEKDRLEKVGKVIDGFNSVSKGIGSQVVLRRVGDGSAFKVVLATKDPFLNADTYQSGDAYLYISKEVYSQIELLASKVGCDVDWNNTGSTGWLSKMSEGLGEVRS